MKNTIRLVLLAAVSLLLLPFNLSAQGLGIGDASFAPDASALFEMQSTTQGFLVPRMVEADRISIAAGSPPTGLLVYQTDGSDGFYVYDGTEWRWFFDFPAALSDADGNTTIHVEQLPNEDKIHFSTGGTERMTITNSGSVGIGTTAPGAALDVVDVDGLGVVDFQTAGPATAFSIDAAGVVSIPLLADGSLTLVAGVLTSSSDMRLKNDHGSYAGGLDVIRGLNPIRYSWNKASHIPTDKEQVGFSAQNVKSQIPEAVGENANGYLTLSDRPIIAALVNAVKEQQEMIDALKKENEELKSLKQRLDRLEQLIEDGKINIVGHE